MSKIISNILCIILAIPSILMADDNLWPDTISGVVVSAVDSENATFALLECNKKNIWVKIPKTKLITGKLYDIYPPIIFEKNKTIGKHKNLTVFHSGGVVEKLEKDISFKGISLWTPMSEVKEKLEGYKFDNIIVLKNAVSDIKTNDISIANLEIGFQTYDIFFSGDIHNKLSSIVFTSELNQLNLDSESIRKNLDYLSDLFKEKYGEPTSCVDLKNLSPYESTSHCVWKLGDTSIGTNYRYNTNTHKIVGVIGSQSRMIQTHNYYGYKAIELENKREALEKQVIKEAAKSF